MKKADLVPIIFGIGMVLFFALETGRVLYGDLFTRFPLVITFFKFSLLATGGEIISSRIRIGEYRLKGFGLFPKMVIWGILGLGIYAAFGIFSGGVPGLFAGFLARFNENRVAEAFLVSLFMNLFFAPVMMLSHNLTDIHIAEHGGRFPFRTLRPLSLFEKVDWSRMWGFVFSKTIPFFWIPAHTITFLLPSRYRTLFAALLSVALGLLLGIAGRKKEKPRG